MKSLFNLFFLSLSLNLQARDIVLITYKEYPEKAKLIQTLLEREIHIPSSLIKQSAREIPCQADREAAFHICVDGSGEMIILKRDEELAREAFSIFTQDQNGGTHDVVQK